MNPRPVTRTDFCMSLAIAGYGLLRLLVLSTRAHTRKT